MPIERVSRYYDGTLAQVTSGPESKFQIAVFRLWPDGKEVTYFNHTWVITDSLAALAQSYCGGSKYWWEIMDINPEILDPFNIEPGTVIRIPNE